MPPRLLHPDEYELVSRSSLDSRDSFDLDGEDFNSHPASTSPSYLRHRQGILSRVVLGFLPYLKRRTIFGQTRSRAAWKSKRQHGPFPRRYSIRRLCYILHIFTGIVFALVVLTAVFRPSYTSLPDHYEALRRRVRDSESSGRGNPRNEKVFIAASIYDRGGKLARGQWADDVLQLITLLGEENVYLSIYENDSGDEGQAALAEFEARVKCDKSIVYEPHLDVEEVTHITLPDGTERTKRIAYLAEVRNRALRPLDKADGEVRYDKLLYINDVVFDSVDALNLLFSTNADENGVAQYRAACSVDFINPFKFYDTFATRDLEGYSMGVPFYPWFSSAGNAESRNDVLQQKDAVRVRSCWGGMVAFDAKFFQHSSTNQDPADSSPARFRAEPDPYWDASECCLIHADIQIPPPSDSDSEEPVHTGIYMNPFVRVAYDTKTLSWLGVTRRFERLYSIMHLFINHLAGLPRFNPRRTEKAGEMVEEKVWVVDDRGKGSYQTLERKAGTGGFCGRRSLQVMVPNPAKGQKNWEMLPVPPG